METLRETIRNLFPREPNIIVVIIFIISIIIIIIIIIIINFCPPEYIALHISVNI